MRTGDSGEKNSPLDLVGWAFLAEGWLVILVTFFASLSLLRIDRPKHLQSRPEIRP